MPGPQTTPGRLRTRDVARSRVAFRKGDSVGAQNLPHFVARWLACTLPYRRFACVLADADARLGADVVRYSFIAVDLHHLLLAGLPAHHPSGESASSPPNRANTRSYVHRAQATAVSIELSLNDDITRAQPEPSRRR